MDLAQRFDEIRKEVSQCPEAASAWLKILRLVGEDRPQQHVVSASTDAESLTNQLQRIFDRQPPPRTLSLFYFGLFENAERRSVLYLSGSSQKNHREALDENLLDYFPEDRFLNSGLLECVDKAKSSSKMRRSDHEYLMPFAAAAVVVKGAADSIGFKVPVYVGFDAGDYAKIRD